MKRVVPICTYFLSAAVALGQGSVWFRNGIRQQYQPVDAPFFDDHGVRLEGSNYVAQLYAWNTGEGFQPVGTAVPFATNGYFYAGRVVVPFVGVCAPAWVQVRAWQVDGSASFEQAASAGAWTGVSGVLFLPQTGSPGRPEACLDALLFGLQYPGRPLVLRQPRAQAARLGERATLSVVTSSGVQMSYQWYQDPSDRPDGLIVGATNTTYTTPALSTGTTFWVTVTLRWSGAMKVNHDNTQTDQWNPAITVNPAGTELFIGHYSRQKDPNTNRLINGGHTSPRIGSRFGSRLIGHWPPSINRAPG